MGTEHAATTDATHGAAPSLRPSPVEMANALIESSGISRRLWRLYAYAWFICLLFPVVALVQGQHTVLQMMSAAAGLALFVGCYLWVMWPHPLRSVAAPRITGRSALALGAGLTLLVLALSVGYGSAFLWLLVGISAIVGVTFSARAAFAGVMALTLITLGGGIAISGGTTHTDWMHLLPLVLLVRGVGLDMAGLRRLGIALHDLYAARREVARLAVLDERLRLSRDLHDLLGHALSLIALKSELARRILPSAPERAADELLAVEQAARQTLREVREAVADYRQPTLASELDGAHQLLEAAGIVATITEDIIELSPAVDAVLAWAVREGVTNVIRHSCARWCRITVAHETGVISAEVINDGVGEVALEPIPIGGGLTGLRERVAAQGGSVEAGTQRDQPGAIFRLRACLPLASLSADTGA